MKKFKVRLAEITGLLCGVFVAITGVEKAHGMQKRNVVVTATATGAASASCSS